MKYSVFWLFLILPSIMPAQYNNGFMQEYFFGPMPSVRAEAMGHTSVASGNSVSTLFSNPATLGRVEDLEIDVVTSAPYYILRESDFYFLGGAYRFHPKLVGALSFHQFAMGPTTFDLDINGVKYPVDAPKLTNIALSLAGSPIENLQLGLNLNHLRWKYLDEVSTESAFHFDLGALYSIAISETESSSSRLRFGGSFTNFAKSTITFASPAGDEATSEFPMIGRLGVAYEMEKMVSYPGVGEGEIGLNLTMEYHGLFNNAYRRGIQMGGEVVFLRLLAVRIGYLSLNNDDGGLPEFNFSRQKDLTYGFGFIVPIDELSKKNMPFKLFIDYYSMEPPLTSNLGGRLPNRRGFSFRLVRNLSTSSNK